jgi:hypothetical protein
MTVYCCKRIFRYGLSSGTFGYTLVFSTTWAHAPYHVTKRKKGNEEGKMENKDIKDDKQT